MIRLVHIMPHPNASPVFANALTMGTLMFSTRCAVLALGILVLPGCATSGGYQGRPLAFNYDAMENETLVFTPVTDEAHPMMTVSFSFAGQAQAGPIREGTISFSERSREWRYLRNHEVLIVLNGSDRLRYEGDHTGDIGDGGVEELVTVDVPLADFERIASAQTVAIRLGERDFSLRPGEIARIRHLVDAMAGRPAPTPGAPD